MPVITSYDPKKNTLTIKVYGIFDFSAHHTFHKATEQISAIVKMIVIDLQEVNHIESEALGMLLLIKEKSIVYQQSVDIINIQHAVKKSLTIANFDKLFNLH